MNKSYTLHYKEWSIETIAGDIVLFRNGFVPYNPLRYISGAIRIFTNCKWNHCGTLMPSWGVLMLNEAKEFGVVSRPAEKFINRKKTQILILRRKESPDNPGEAAFCMRATSKLGCPYDFLSLLCHQLWFRITGNWVGKTKEAAENAMVCSEYVAWCHGLENWWELSAAELLVHPYFEIVFDESKQTP